MSVTVENRPAQNQYALVEDGETVGFAAYDVVGDEIRFTHTEIEPSRRRAGLGAQLVQGALDDVRAGSDRRVVPLCPFVVEWIDEHVDYQELLRR
jgi:predicted GNAT family acetyltransferase